MTKVQFTKAMLAILKEYKHTNDTYHYIFDNNAFGKFQLSFEANGRNKLYSVRMKFIDMDKFDLDLFYHCFSKHENINPYTHKWNIVSSDPQYVLVTIEERLDNLNWVNDKDNLEITLKA